MDPGKADICRLWLGECSPADSAAIAAASAKPQAVRRAFTLIEMLLATVLSAVLMFAVLTMLAGVSRDRKLLQGMNVAIPVTGAVELLRWDLTNARSWSPASDNQSLVLNGIGGIDSTSLTPDGRWVQINYRIQAKNLWRIQEYLDSPTRNGAWQELVAVNVSGISVDQSAQHVNLRLSTEKGQVDQALFIK